MSDTKLRRLDERYQKYLIEQKDRPKILEQLTSVGAGEVGRAGVVEIKSCGNSLSKSFFAEAYLHARNGEAYDVALGKALAAQMLALKAGLYVSVAREESAMEDWNIGGAVLISLCMGDTQLAGELVEAGQRWVPMTYLREGERERFEMGKYLDSVANGKGSELPKKAEHAIWSSDQPGGDLLAERSNKRFAALKLSDALYPQYDVMPLEIMAVNKARVARGRVPIDVECVTTRIWGEMPDFEECVAREMDDYGELEDYLASYQQSVLEGEEVVDLERAKAEFASVLKSLDLE